jgi:hypothetical protein
MFLVVFHQLNSRYEYPAEIDLGEFLDSTADKTMSWVYKLHGIIIHDGTMESGQYVTMFKPSRDGRWLKFDDDRVTYATNYEVFDDNFGHGEDSATRDPQGSQYLCGQVYVEAELPTSRLASEPDLPLVLECMEE